jgi:beta-galactosidase GanA
MKRKVVFTVCFCIGFYLYAQQLLPRIETYNGVKQLIVNKAPFIMLSGELHNSSSSSLEYMKPVWGKLKDMNLNTVIASVSWELFEPAEGKYDYALVEGLIKDARKHNLKLVFIWFATWKNAWSTYAPEWVKKDWERFPRMQTVPGRNTGALSAWGEATMKADARVFAELMRFIK